MFVNNVEQRLPRSGFLIIPGLASVVGDVRVIEYLEPDATFSTEKVAQLSTKTDVGIGIDLLSLFVNMSNGNSSKAQSNALNLLGK